MIRIYLEHGSQVSHTNDKNETMMALLHFCWLVVVKNNFLAFIRIRVRIEMLGWIRIRLKRIRFSSTATVVRKATARLFRLKILTIASFWIMRGDQGYGSGSGSAKIRIHFPFWIWFRKESKFGPAQWFLFTSEQFFLFCFFLTIENSLKRIVYKKCKAGSGSALKSG